MCNVPDPAQADEMHFSDQEDNRIDGFGISADTNAADKMSAGCPYRLKIDASDPSVKCNGGWCEGSPYIKNGKSVPASQIPKDVKAELDAKAFPEIRTDSRAYYSPADPEYLSIPVLQIPRCTAFAQTQRLGLAFDGIDLLINPSSISFCGSSRRRARCGKRLHAT